MPLVYCGHTVPGVPGPTNGRNAPMVDDLPTSSARDDKFFHRHPQPSFTASYSRSTIPYLPIYLGMPLPINYFTL
ncbi:hypothetical protein BDV27DRAFT_139106 [Aspergillus caelatus]|uniref:Uncharacterized protein n=1 Tax=Aspergillus caelatus TaxID=61420 RepID=A0A5N6ZIW8_9EURO|nr:uncharacterized protein BDV27DRAFT_139106 [Aspergillus caelatus]KAE8357582.1 hypothetical protein BDV27DRAFT_139106 [Aspergillus caelatus]